MNHQINVLRLKKGKEKLEQKQRILTDYSVYLQNLEDEARECLEKPSLMYNCKSKCQTRAICSILFFTLLEKIFLQKFLYF